MGGQLELSMRGQEHQHVATGRVAPIGLLPRGRTPARAQAPEPGGGKSLEPHHHPSAITKQDFAFPIGLLLEALAFQSPLAPGDPGRHDRRQIFHRMVLTDVAPIRGQAALERMKAGQSRPDFIELPAIYGRSEAFRVPELPPPHRQPCMIKTVGGIVLAEERKGALFALHGQPGVDILLARASPCRLQVGD